MSEEAQEAWRDIVKAQGGEPWQTRADRTVLRILVETVAINRQAATLLRAGVLVRGRNRAQGEVVKSPAWQPFRESAELIRLYAVQLGLTPAARAALRLEAPIVHDDPMAGVYDAIGEPPQHRWRNGTPTYEDPATRAHIESVYGKSYLASLDAGETPERSN
jgi:P27 family predicted phage terminase small subunit